ncbi:hypothetical protein, partial [Photorhabdus heterorhabditis]|uniref:hypothetical protein n=1 Tax=Photorhabdus heterorhabditis TaxID=880156 RepID=UPI001CB6CFD7
HTWSPLFAKYPCQKSQPRKIAVIHPDSDRLVAVVPKGIRRLSPSHNDALAKLCHVKYRFTESRSYQSGL